MQLRSVLALCLLLFSCSAFAESPQLTLAGLEAIEADARHSEAICEQVRRDPNCRLSRTMMRNSLGLSVDKCRITVAASDCDSFFQQYPEYANNRMRCDPYGLCKTALRKTLLQGCGRVLAREVGEPIQAGWDCLTSWECWKNGFRASGRSLHRVFTSPLQSMIDREHEAIDNAGRSVIGAIDDYRKTTKLACLDAETQAELECYLAGKYVGGIILTRFAVGRMAKLARDLKKTMGPYGRPAFPRIARRVVSQGKTAVAVAVTALRPSAPARREIRSAASGASDAGAVAAVTVPAWKRIENITQFRTRLATFDPTTDAQRADMMKTVFSRAARGSRVLDVENSLLKSLNDNEWLRVRGGPWVKDKDLVTVLTNQHKEILAARMAEFAQKYKGKLDLKSYSDFKSQRFALIPTNRAWSATGIPESVLLELDAVYRAANDEFAGKLRTMGIESKVDPSTWFKAGLDANADEANLNARFARDLPNHGGGIVRSDHVGLSEMKQAAYREIAEARQSLSSLPNGSPLLANVDGIRLPTPEVFDIVKKSDGDIEKLKRVLRASYPGVEVDDQLARNLVDYSKKTDRFQPGIWQSSREVASVAEAKFGGVTIDVKGMGSNNAFQTALQAARCSSPAFIAQCTRDGERTVTREFRDKMNAIRDVALGNCQKYGVQCFVRISGDDVVVIPTNKPFPRGYARDNVNGINQAIGTAQVRQAEIGPGITGGPNRVTLGQHGESIEKILRTNLESGPLAERARGITFSVQMRSEIPDIGRVQIRLSGPGADSLTPAERRTLIETYRRSITDFNNKAPGERQYELAR